MLLALALSLPAVCPQQAAESQTLDVIPGVGAFVRRSADGLPADGFGRHALLSAPRWQITDQGSAWIGGSMALGDSGASLMAGRYLNAEAVSLHATGDAAALFENATTGSESPQVAHADRAPLGAALVTYDRDPNTAVFDFESELQVFDTTEAGTPLWTYTFPLSGNNYGGGVLISDGGEVVLAWKANANTAQCQIEAFDAAGNLLSSGSLSSGSNYSPRQVRLSDDGTRAYFFIGVDAHIYDVATASVIHTHTIGASFDSHAFSGDGKSFAYGSFGALRVYQEQGGSWIQRHSESFPGGTYIGFVDLDRTGDRCAFQLQRYTPAYDHIETGLVDVANGSLLWSDSLDAPGTTFQLVCSGVKIADDGDVVVSCSWGDSLNATPEVACWDAAGTRTVEIDLPGSAFGLDLDPDGDVWASGSKGVHANTFGNGGAITLGDAAEQALHLRGVPRSGQSVQLQIADGWQRARLGVGTRLGATVTPFGPSEIDLQQLLYELRLPVPSGGLDIPVTIPPIPALQGVLLHMQALLRSGGTVAWSNKVSARVLP